MKRQFITTVLFLLLAGNVFAQNSYVLQKERQIPVAYNVDVLVVGGSTGAVAAAVEARKAGAETMLITHRPYLGDDLTASLRLWKSEDEKSDDPLFAALYDDPYHAESLRLADQLNRMKQRLSFKYEIDEAIDPAHSETSSRNRLNDGFASDVYSHSLQINGNATIRIDLKQEKEIDSVALSVFYRKNDFALEKASVSASKDGQSWVPLGALALENTTTRNNDSSEVFRFSTNKPVKTRYLKIEALKADSAKRLLLAEIVVLPAQTEGPEKAETFKSPKNVVPRPMHVKKTLDQALLDAGVRFLYGSYCTDLLEDENGKLGGILINNRAGRQAIVAKTVLVCDNVSNLESTKEESFIVEFVVIGGKAKTNPDLNEYPLLKSVSHEAIPGSFLAEVFKGRFFGEPISNAASEVGDFPIHLYRFEIESEAVRDFLSGNLKMRGELEKQVRLATFDPAQQFTADEISIFPKNTSEKSRPNPANLIRKGRADGKAAASEALQKNKIEYSKLRPSMSNDAKSDKIVSGEIRQPHENTKAFRTPLGYIDDPQSAFPVVGEYDVVVVGGGVTGVPAGIAAARRGAKTLVLEYLHDLGGMGTAGAITVYCFGNRVGFCKEVQNGQSDWNIEQKIFWWRSKLAEAGAEAWYGVLGCGTVVEMKDGVPTVKGVLIATENGPAIVLAKVVVDATGNGGVAESAGAGIHYVDDKEIAIQGHGLPPRRLGAAYANTDYMYVDETDAEDVTHLFVYGKEKFPKSFDFGKIPDTRERRQIDGEFRFTALDQVNGRTYPDTILVACSNYDTHGYTVDPYMELEHFSVSQTIWCDVPFRSSLPRGIDGILVGGLAMSCHRDALPIVRMQPDLQNHGYALGCIAAQAARSGVSLRRFDIKSVQKHLVEIGNLPERVLTDTDNYGTTIDLLPEAIKTVTKDFKGAAQLLWYPERSVPLLRKAYAETTSKDDKLVYAMTLAAMSDPTGADTIRESIQSHDKWDKGWNFRAMHQFGWSSSPLDRLVMMLGRTRDPRGIEAIVGLLKKLEAKDDFSHHRACALALEWIGDHSAAQAVYEHLKKPGVSGYVHHDLETARKWDRADPHIGTAERSRRNALIEIGFARTLYRLGDIDGLGRSILEDYSKDLRGIFSRHANEVLHESK